MRIGPLVLSLDRCCYCGGLMWRRWARFAVAHHECLHRAIDRSPVSRCTCGYGA